MMTFDEDEAANLDEEAALLQDSVDALVATNREFIRLLSVIINRTTYKSARFRKELLTVYKNFQRAEANLKTLHVIRDEQSQ